MIARVVDELLSLSEHEDAVADKAAGAVVSFSGVVRDHDGGRSVTELEYVGHPTAPELIAEIAAAFAACAELVDEVKARLPIWKRQVFTDGEEEWVACP